MTRVRVDLNISLDGFATTTDQTPENPFGDDWGRLTAAYVGTRTFRERVLHDASGAGTTGVDDDYAARYFEAVGAEIMGAAMFGLHEHPDDPAWKGWGGMSRPSASPSSSSRTRHVAVAPLLLGRGIRLWDDLRGLEADYDVTTEAAPSGITHVTFRRR